MRKLVLISLAGALLVTGCKMGPDYKRPSITSPANWRTPAPLGDSLANVAWWDFYRDPALTNLIAIALTNNLDLRLTAARVEEAMGGYRAQRSYLLPEINGAADWTRARSGLTRATGNTYDVLGLLSYEVDVWGRLRRLTEAARAQLLASEEGRMTVRIGLVAGVAGTYFDLRTLDAQLEVARRTYASRTNFLALAKTKFGEENGQGWGIVSELDVRQAETQVYAAQSSIATLERAVALTENALSVLIGNNPGPIARGTPLAQQTLPGPIPAGLPSDLLLRRPDLRAAEQQLIAANANIGAARAAYFPAISLTAALGLQSTQLDDLFSAGLSKTWKFAPQIAGPIFNAGRTRAGVQVAEARQKAALAVYEQAIQNAFREVEDALVSVAKLREELQAEEANVQAERRRLELSRLRYEGGVSSYSDVLDAERYLFTAELTAIQTRGNLLAAGALLYKALGGGWNIHAPIPAKQ